MTKLKDIKKIQPKPLVEDILKSDSGNVPQALWEESNEFLVNEDISPTSPGQKVFEPASPASRQPGSA